MKNPKWKRAELILALDLYFKCDINRTSEKDPRIIELSDLLRNTSEYNIDEIDPNSFRSPDSVHMKLCNFLQYDPNYRGKGLWRGNKLEKEIWEEFYNNKERLAGIAGAIRNSIGLKDTVLKYADGDEAQFNEGKLLYCTHRMYERNEKIINLVKKRAIISTGKLECSVCGFDFYSFYGEIGLGFIECHHTKPLHEYKSEDKTSMHDLRLICSNCHRMIHRTKPMYTVEELKNCIASKDKKD